jgi:GNAT superfamily N-acetyltransferase
MWWRFKTSEFNRQKGEGNRKALKRIVDSGEIPGILAYADDQPAGWCSVGRRESYLKLERSQVLGRVDDKPVWSIVCFFVAKPFRHRGLTASLLKSAIAYVERQGGKIIEGYPAEPKEGKIPDPFAYTGLASAFRKTGFVEVLRRSETRPIMRYTIEKK